MTLRPAACSRQLGFLGGSILALVALLVAPSARAGQRHTVWAYPPGAGPKGMTELETWITTSRESRETGTAAEYRVEIENGLTDEVSVDVYLGVLKQAPGESVKFDRVQASLRANLFGPEIRKAIELTGYFEVKRDIDFSNPWEFELILIGGKSWGRFGYDFNMVYESEISSKAFQKASRELKGIVGAGWEISPRFWAGAEVVLANEGGTRKLSLGPTISVSLSDKTWLAIGPQFGVNDDADQLQVRAIFGVFF